MPDTRKTVRVMTVIAPFFYGQWDPCQIVGLLRYKTFILTLDIPRSSQSACPSLPLSTPPSSSPLPALAARSPTTT